MFPTFEKYVEQFRIFASTICPDGCLAYFSGDLEVAAIAAGLASERPDVQLLPYDVPEYRVEKGFSELLYQGKAYPLQVFGRHNMQNIEAAWQVCRRLGIADEVFLKSIMSFKGASRRLERIGDNPVSQVSVFKDFAHSPSKLQATIGAVKEQYPERKLVACMELHTFSSLSKVFFSHYKGCMDKADVAMVYYNPKAVEHKKLEPIDPQAIHEAFACPRLKVYNDSALLVSDLKSMDWHNANLLWMTSGNFDGVDEKALAEEVCKG